MATVLASNSTFDGMRPVNLRTDLAGIADLIEVCFGATMDESGRAGVREMRMVSQSDSLSLLYNGMDRLMGGLDLGFVWVEKGIVIGNVSLSPANYPRSMGIGYLIANVAVHPNHRHHGIAQALMLAALDLIRQRHGTFAILQVDASNEIAQHLYNRLAFRQERTFTRWIRSAHLRPATRLPEMPFMTLSEAREWPVELKLAELVRPNSAGGLGWLRPTHPDNFRGSIWQTFVDWMTARGEEHWIVRGEDGTSIQAVLRVRMSFGGSDKLELLVHPSQQGKLEEPLLNAVLRRLEGRHRSVIMEHPADDPYATRVLEYYGFEPRFTLIHMRKEL
ncbi:MAG: GNAT family N-acetyltransferase [Chloroflexota bacterium]